MIKVAIFDDHTERREALTMLINVQADMVCTGSFENCARVIEDLQPEPPDVVLMDIEMPQVNGIEGVRLIRQGYPNMLVIIQTVFEDDDKIFQCIQNGAHGYILKKAPPQKVIESIYDVCNGGAPMTSSIATRVLQQFRNQSATNNRNTSAHFELTDRELQIISLLAKGFSHKMIGAELFISPFTVSNHIKKIYQKLQVNNVSGAVSIALKEGLVK